MPFILAEGFQTRLNRLTAAERKAAKLIALELQVNPSNPYLLCQLVDNMMGKNVWPFRASHPSGWLSPALSWSAPSRRESRLYYSVHTSQASPWMRSPAGCS